MRGTPAKVTLSNFTFQLPLITEPPKSEGKAGKAVLRKVKAFSNQMSEFEKCRKKFSGVLVGLLRKVCTFRLSKINSPTAFAPAYRTKLCSPERRRILKDKNLLFLPIVPCTEAWYPKALGGD